MAFLLRFAAGEALLARDAALFPDSELYWGYARSLLLGNGFKLGLDGARRTPGYPVFLATVWTTTGRTTGGVPDLPAVQNDIRVVLIAQALLGAWTAVLTVSLTRSFGLRRPLLAGWLVAVEPYSVLCTGALLTEVPATALLVLAHLLYRTDRPWAAGAAFGLSVLVRPSALPLLGLLVALDGWRNPRRVFVAVAGTVLVLSPWWARNAMRYQTFVPTTLNVGESLYDGLRPDATGGSDMRFLDRPPPLLGVFPAEREVERDRHWRREALRWARENPGETLRLAAVKAGRFLSPWPNAENFQQTLLVAWSSVYWTTVYAAAAVFLWRDGRRHRALTAHALAPVLLFLTLHMVFVSSVRYRVPVVPHFALLAAAALPTKRGPGEGASAKVND